MTVAMAKVPNEMTETQVNTLPWEDLAEQALEFLTAYAEKAGLTVQSETLDPVEHFRFQLGPLAYPDKIGSGVLHVWGEHVLGYDRIQARVEHNRVFSGSTRRVYLNDFQFARKIPPGTTDIRRTLKEITKGMTQTLDAVDRVRARTMTDAPTMTGLTLRVSSTSS